MTGSSCDPSAADALRSGFPALVRAIVRRWLRRRRERAYLETGDHRIAQELLAHRCEEEEDAPPKR